MSFSSMAVDWEKGKKKKKSPTAFSIKLSVENPPNSFPEMSVENGAAPGSRGRLRIPASPGFQPASENPCAVGSGRLSIAGGGPLHRPPSCSPNNMPRSKSCPSLPCPVGQDAGQRAAAWGNSGAGTGALFSKGNGWDKSQRGKLGPAWRGSRVKISPGMQASGVLLK